MGARRLILRPNGGEKGKRERGKRSCARTEEKRENGSEESNPAPEWRKKGKTGAERKIPLPIIYYGVSRAARGLLDRREFDPVGCQDGVGAADAGSAFDVGVDERCR